MFKIGLTGGIGSGKSTAAAFFLSQGIDVIDLDQIARSVVQPGTPALKQIQNRFGNEILTTTGSLNRKKLAEIIFSDNAEKLWLEALLHPLIKREKERVLKNSMSPYVVIEIPLLVENQLQSEVNRVLLIDSTEELQVERAKLRGNQTEEQIRKIIKSQATRDERKKQADDIAENSGSEQELEIQLQHLHQKYLRLAKEE